MSQQQHNTMSSSAALLLLLTVFASTVASPALAQIPGLPGGIPGVPKGISGVPAGGIPGLPGGIPGVPKGISGVPAGGIPGVPGGTDCLANLSGIPGCIQEVVRSFSGREVANIGSSCCKVLLDGGDRCWMRFSQFSPVSLGSVKDYCRSPVQAAAPRPVPVSVVG